MNNKEPIKLLKLVLEKIKEYIDTNNSSKATVITSKTRPSRNDVKDGELFYESDTCKMVYLNKVSGMWTYISTVEDDSGENANYGNIIVSKTSLEINETSRGAFTVKLDKEPLNDQNVIITVTKGKNNISLNKTTLTFTPSNYNTAQTITVYGEHFPEDFDDKTATINISSEKVLDKNVNITIKNIDTNPEPNINYGNIIISKTALSVEEGGNNTFTVKLDSKPSQDQTVTLSISDNNISLNKTTLTFTPSNYNTAQTITVTGAHNNSDYSDKSSVITIRSTYVSNKTINVVIKNIDEEPDIGDNEEPDVPSGDEGSYIETDVYKQPSIKSDALYVGAGQKYSTVAAALNALGSNGGQIVIKGGTYSETVTFTQSGKSTNPIVITNAPNETVIFDGGNKGESITMFNLNGKSNIVLYGLEIRNCNSGSGEAYAILGEGGEKGIVIANCIIHDVKTTGNGSGNGEANAILLFGESSTPISDVLIYNNHIYDMTTNWSESISVAGNCENVRIINNKLHDLTNIAMGFYGNAGYCSNASLDQPRNCVMRGNVVYNLSCNYASAAAYYCDGARDCVIENNIAYNCATGIEIGAEEGGNFVGNIIVRNNLIYDSTGYESCTIKVGGYQSKSQTVTNVKFINNTFATNKSGTALFAWGKAKEVEFTNNIFYIGSSGGNFLDYVDYPIESATFHNNIYYYKGKSESNFSFSLDDNTFYNWSNWKSKYDTNGKYVTSTPFNSDYTLFSSSPAIDAGYSTNDAGSYDLAGNPRKNGTIDIGCYEK